MTTLEQKTAAFITHHGLMQPGDRVLVAVSGGVDSMVLLHVLQQLRERWRLCLLVGHFNHQLRGADSDADEELVRSFCKSTDLPFSAGRRDVAAWCREHKHSIETGGRILRYAFLRELALSRHCRRIAMAHHGDDQAETVMAHVLRGSGVTGLAGIPVARGPVIRPLLFAAKSEIEAYAESRDLTFRQDASNQDVRFRRNRIRHELLPMLTRDYNPGLQRALSRLAEAHAEADVYLKHQAAEAYEVCLRCQDAEKIILDISCFLAYLIVLKKYVLRHTLTAMGLDARLWNARSYALFFQFLERRRIGVPFRLGVDLTIEISADSLMFLRKRSAPPQVDISSLPGTFTLWDGLELSIAAERLPLERIRENSCSRYAWVDADLLQGTLLVRPAQNGDRFQPLNLSGSKKLTDYFSDRKIPRPLRSAIPVLVCKEDIVWVCGYRLDDRFKVTEQTSRMYRLTLRKQRESAI